jgi:hypothetical protein
MAKNNVNTPSEQKSKIHWKDYFVGGLDRDGDKITSVIDKTDEFCVYMIERFKGKGEDEEKLVWDATEKVASAAYYAAVARSLETRIDTGLLTRYRKYARRLAASCLSIAFEDNLEKRKKDGKEKEDYFTEAREFIDTKASEIAQLQYLGMAFSMAFLFSTIIFSIPSLYGDMYRPLVGGAFGAIGAFVSVLIRFRKIKIKEYSMTFYTAIRGTTRVLLGFLFGVIFVIIQESGVIGVGNGNVFSIYTLSFISGFTERFVPELMAKVKSTSLSEESEQASSDLDNGNDTSH